MLGQSNTNTIATYIKIENEDITVTQNGVYEASEEYTGLGTVTVQVDSVNNQDKTVYPTIYQQIVQADQGYSGIGTVTITPVTYAIDNNIQAGNIKSGVNILGVQGSVTELNGTSLSITPTAASQSHTPTAPNNAFTSVSVAGDQNLVAGNIVKDVTIFGVTGSYEGQIINNQNITIQPSTTQEIYTADVGYTGLGTVTAAPVTAAIDENIVAGNIAKDVTILGVTGTYEGTVINNQNKSVTVDGTYTPDPEYTGLGEVVVTAGAVVAANIEAQLHEINSGTS